MTRLKNGISIGLFTVMGLGAHSWGQADYMPPMSGWPAAVLSAWQIQGEYYGTQTNGTAGLGVWLVANGGTSFGLVVLPGGLLTMPGQPYGGWTGTTRYQGASGPAAGTLNGKIFNVATSTGGYVADSITGTAETRSLYLHNTNGTSFVLQRVKRHSPTFGLRASQMSGVAGAAGVVSLFDSSTGAADLAKWAAGDNAVQLKYNYLFRGIRTAASFGRMFLHIEFLSCFNPTATGQGRANSGIYQQGRYETQVLDNFGMSGAIDEYGAIYSIRAPNLNAELPPQVTLQTYDIYFTPRTSGATGTTTGSAYFTVYANGVKVQDSTLAPQVTTAPYVAFGTTDAPIYLQNHGNEVVFNNIWVVPNATTSSLPYTNVLSAGGVTATNPFRFKPLSVKKGLNIFGNFGSIDMTGRKIRRNGVLLNIQPVALPQH